MGISKYRPVRKQPFLGPSAARAVLIDRSSSLDRALAFTNLLVSATLAAAALWLGYTYHSNEQLDREKERQREDRRDALTAQMQMENSVAKCMQYNIDLSKPEKLDPKGLSRVAIARQIGQNSVYCRRIGWPLDERIEEAALARLVTAPDPVIAQAGQQALRLVRRERSAPPPSLRKKADAYRALGGRAYYLSREELEIPVGSASQSLGLRPAFILDGGTLVPIPESTVAEPVADRFFLGDPQIRGFDIRGVGPRVTRAPAEETGNIQ